MKVPRVHKYLGAEGGITKFLGATAWFLYVMEIPIE